MQNVLLWSGGNGYANRQTGESSGSALNTIWWWLFTMVILAILRTAFVRNARHHSPADNEAASFQAAAPVADLSVDIRVWNATLPGWSVGRSTGMRIVVRQGWVRVAFLFDPLARAMGMQWLFAASATTLEQSAAPGAGREWIVLSSARHRVAITAGDNIELSIALEAAGFRNWA